LLEEEALPIILQLAEVEDKVVVQHHGVEAVRQELKILVAVAEEQVEIKILLEVEVVGQKEL
jgi:hypothetical protein